MAQSSGPGWPALGPGSSGWKGAYSDIPEPPPEPKRWYERRTLWLTVAICSAVGYLAVGVLATGRVYWEFHRKPTQGELYRAATDEVRDRWRTWPAERIFPRTVPYTAEQGDVEEAMNAAKQIGDDALQRNAGRAVVPESFTHGTSAQRQRWFDTGLKTGSVQACDTFSARNL